MPVVRLDARRPARATTTAQLAFAVMQNAKAHALTPMSLSVVVARAGRRVLFCTSTRRGWFVLSARV